MPRVLAPSCPPHPVSRVESPPLTFLLDWLLPATKTSHFPPCLSFHQVEAYAGGNLAWYRGGFKDPEHFHEGSAFSNYNLWVLRDQLVPATYKPSDIKVWQQ